MLGVLTIIKKQANKSILLENSNAPTLQDQMSGVKVHLPHKKVLWDTSLSFFPASEASKKKKLLSTNAPGQRRNDLSVLHLRASQRAAKSLKGSEVG